MALSSQKNRDTLATTSGADDASELQPVTAETRESDVQAKLAARLMNAIILKLHSEPPEDVHPYVELGVKLIEAMNPAPAQAVPRQRSVMLRIAGE